MSDPEFRNEEDRAGVPTESVVTPSEESSAGPDANGNLFQQGILAVVRTVLAGLGFVLIPLGVIIALLTPGLPIGLPIVIFGVVLVSRNSGWGRQIFQSLLAKYPKLERFSPDWLLRMIFGGDYTKSSDPKKS